MQAFIQITLRFPAEDVPELERHVKASGQSRYAYLIDAIRARIAAENAAVTGQ